MGDTKPYPVADDAPLHPSNDFKPESGPAIKNLEKARQDVGTPQTWGKPMKNNYKGE